MSSLCDREVQTSFQFTFHQGFASSFLHPHYAYRVVKYWIMYPTSCRANGKRSIPFPLPLGSAVHWWPFFKGQSSSLNPYSQMLISMEIQHFSSAVKLEQRCRSISLSLHALHSISTPLQGPLHIQSVTKLHLDSKLSISFLTSLISLILHF